MVVAVVLEPYLAMLRAYSSLVEVCGDILKCQVAHMRGECPVHFEVIRTQSNPPQQPGWTLLSLRPLSEAGMLVGSLCMLASASLRTMGRLTTALANSAQCSTRCLAPQGGIRLVQCPAPPCNTPIHMLDSSLKQF